MTPFTIALALFAQQPDAAAAPAPVPAEDRIPNAAADD